VHEEAGSDGVGVPPQHPLRRARRHVPDPDRRVHRARHRLAAPRAHRVHLRGLRARESARARETETEAKRDRYSETERHTV
jgi:hypothetical protein